MASAGGEAEHVVVRLPFLNGFQFAGYYAAQAQGYFREAGLDVRLEPTGSGGNAIADLVSGRAQYGVLGSEALLERLNGKPLVLVMTVFQHSGFGLVVDAKSPIRTPSDLAGRRVALGTAPRDSELWAMLMREGVRRDAVELVPERWDVNEIQEGEADAMAIFYANRPQLYTDGDNFRTMRPSSYGVDFYGDGLVTTETELKRHPDRVERMRTAVIRGWVFALANPDSMVDYIAQNVPDLRPALTRQGLVEEAVAVRELVVADLVEIGHVNRGRWAEIARTYVKLGLARDTARLEGFIFTPPGPVSYASAVFQWAAIAFGILGLIGAGIVIWNIRLQRLVDQNTAALRRSENHFREVFNNLPVATVELDCTGVLGRLRALKAAGVENLSAHFDGNPGVVDECIAAIRVTGCNARALTFLGMSDIGTLTARFPNLGMPGLPAALRRILETVWSNQRSTSCDLELTGSPDAGRQTLMQWTAIASPDGRPDWARTVMAISDLTEQRKAEARLQRSEDRWELAVRGLNVGLWEYDFTTERAFFSDRWKEMLGFLPEELTASREEFWSRIHPDDLARARLAMQAHIDHASPYYNAEVRLRCKDGSYLWVMSRGQALFDAAGKPQRIVGAHTDISEHKEAERALRMSEVRYRALFESAVEGVYESEADGTFRAVNPALARILGHASPAELIERVGNGRGVYRQRGRRREFLEALGSNDTVTDFQSEAVCADGTTKWISENVRAIRDPQGELLYLQGFVSDITERRRADSALRASEERYRVLFEHSPVAIVEYDYRAVGQWLNDLRNAGVQDLDTYMAENPEGLSRSLHQIVPAGMNEAVVKLVGGRSKQEVADRMDWIFTEDAYLARQRAFVAIWKGVNQIEGELTLRALDGTPRLVYYRWWLPVRGGKLDFEWTQLMLVDLTGTKHAEAALATERERLSVTLRAMAESVITTNTDGVIQFINHAAEELVGWKLGSAIGRPIRDVVMMHHQKTQVAFDLPYVEALSRHKVMDLPQHTTLVDRQGAARLVEGRCAPMYDDKDAPMGVVLVLRDIGERARLENEILRASKLESVGILAGGIAHDFNNILTVVLGNLTLAQLDTAPASKTGRWLAEAERGTMRARDLTQQLLTFAKGGDPVRSAVRLPEVVRDSAAFALHGSKVSCEVDVTPDLWPADIDKGQIGQVVQNLVINAVQAMPEGGRIHARLRNHSGSIGFNGDSPRGDGRFVCISMTDTGIGIRPEHLARIFDPYFTTKQSGSGLGLATVYSIIRKHQGHIEVESELGKGTTFRFWLPAATTTPATPAPHGAVGDRLSGRVLFMDDEETIRTMAQALLVRLGFEVVTVSDGAAAVSTYAEALSSGQPFRVVVMDLTVPGGMGGRQAMEELLKIDSGVRAIVSSGYSSDPILANHRAHGFLGVVAKPYRIADLARVLRTVIEQD